MNSSKKELTAAQQWKILTIHLSITVINQKWAILTRLLIVAIVCPIYIIFNRFFILFQKFYTSKMVNKLISRVCKTSIELNDLVLAL